MCRPAGPRSPAGAQSPAPSAVICLLEEFPHLSVAPAQGVSEVRSLRGKEQEETRRIGRGPRSQEAAGQERHPHFWNILGESGGGGTNTTATRRARLSRIADGTRMAGSEGAAHLLRRARQNRSLGRKEAAGPRPSQRRCSVSRSRASRRGSCAAHAGHRCFTGTPPHWDRRATSGFSCISLVYNRRCIRRLPEQVRRPKRARSKLGHPTPPPTRLPVRTPSLRPHKHRLRPPPPPPMRPCNRRHSRPFSLKNPQRHLSASIHVAPTCDSR